MAFINPFLNPKEAAEEYMNEASSVGNALASLVALAPAGIGAVYGAKALRSNEGNFFSSLNTNTMGSMATTVGTNLRSLKRTRDQVQEEMAARLWEDLISDDGIRKNLLDVNRPITAELQAISELMADPASGIDETTSSLIRDKIKNVMLSMEGGIDEQARRQLATVVDTLKNSGAQKELFQKYYKQAQAVQNHIAAPSINIGSRNTVFNPVGEGVFKKLGSRQSDAAEAYEAVKSLYGRKGLKVQLGTVSERIAGTGNDALSVYARVDRGAGRQPLTIPISYARAGNAPIARAGNALATSYSISQSFLDGQVAEELLNSGGKASSALLRPEMAMIKSLDTMSRQAGGLGFVDDQSFGSFQRTFMERLDRVGNINEDFRNRIVTNLQQRTAFTHITNFQNVKDQKGFRSRLVVSEGGKRFESAADAEISLLPKGGSFGKVGLVSSSSIISNQRIAIGANVGENLTPMQRRVLTPLVSRYEQLYDRGSMSFVTQQGVNKSLEIGKQVTSGGTNRAVLIDFGSIDPQGQRISAAARTGLSEGELFMGGEMVVRQPIQPTVIDPNLMTESGKPMMSKKLYNELVEKFNTKGGGRTIRGQKNIREFFNKYGSILGTSGASQVGIKQTPGMQELFIQLESTSDASGQAKVHFAGYTDTSYGGGSRSSLRHAKVYSSFAKGMTRHIDSSGVDEYLGRVLGSNKGDLLANLGFGGGSTSMKILTHEGIAVATSDSVEKAASSLAHQMVSGMAMAMGEDIETAYKSVGVDIDKVFTGGSESAMQGNYVMGVARNVASRMISKGATGRELGMVMAGVYQLAASGAQKQMQDPRGMARGKFNLGVAERNVLTQILGTRGALDVAKQGVAIGQSTFMAGPQSNIYGANMASLEKRMVRQIHYQLTNMFGFNPNQANDFMTGIFSRKTTAPGELAALEALTRTQQNLIGQRLELPDGTKRIGAREFMEAGTSTKKMEALLKSNAKGFVLDLDNTTGMSPQAARRISGWSKEAFGGMSEISLAGGDILDAIKGTKILTASGENKEIGGQYTRSLEHFAQNLQRAASSINQSDMEVKAAKASLAGFRGEMGEVWAGAFNRIMSGKLRGSSWAVSMGWDSNLPGVTDSMRKSAAQAISQTGGQMQFADHQAFVDSMRSFMGGATDEFIAGGMNPQKASRKASKEARNLLSRFFLGMEGGSVEGVTQITGRHPSLGLTHSSAVTTFRLPEEVASLDGHDQAWARIQETQIGKAAITRLKTSTGVDIRGFGDIARIGMRNGQILSTGHGKAVRAFFGDMASNMDAFFGNEGGGTVYHPKVNATVHYANVPGSKGGRSVAMSIASGFGGDHDGDMSWLLNPAGKNAVNLRKGMSDTDNIARVQSYRLRRQIFQEEAKGGINALAKLGDSPQSLEAMIMQGVRKEQAAKAVGPVDIAFDKIRFGLMESPGSGAEKEKLLAILDVLEETMTIKGKKLPQEMGLSEMAVRAVDLAEEGDYRAFSNMIENVAFRDSSLLSPGATVGSVDGLGDIGAKLSGLDISLNANQFQSLVGGALEVTRRRGIGHVLTMRRAMGVANANTQERLRAFEAITFNRGAVETAMAAGNDIETAVASLFGNTAHGMSDAARAFDKRILGPIALGIAGSLAMGASVGTAGYSSRPMMMPGEVIQPEVSQQITSGTLFQQSSPPPVESLQQPENAYANINSRPINTSTIYNNKRNAYSMRGEIASASGIGSIANYLRSGNGSGSVTINDTRRPITANYIDRMMET